MDKNEIRQIIAKRAAMELHDGDIVNLGIGIPTMIPNFLPEGVTVTLQTENGMIGMGPTPEEGKEDPNMINAGGGFITAVDGAASFSSATSFGIIRGGHVDATILGAMQVDVGCRHQPHKRMGRDPCMARYSADAGERDRS